MALRIVNVFLVLIYAFGSGIWVSTGDSWYRSLNEPSWQPPDWIFGTIWPYNFLVLGIAGWVTANNLEKSLALTWSIIFAITIVCALSWARLFYINHNIGSASIALSLTAMFTILLLVLTFKSDWRVGLALTPYQMWVITASFLSFSYYKLN